MTDSDYLIHYGVLGMKWGVRKKKPLSGKSTKNVKTKTKKKKKEISRKEYRKIVKSNKQALRSTKSAWLDAYYTGDREMTKLIEKYDKQAIKNINDARVKRGKKKVKKIMYNLPGTLV